MASPTCCCAPRPRLQIHTMETQKPPIYMICPGTVYRPDTADACHLPQFNQIEGLVVDQGITFGDLKGTLDYFVKCMFGEDRKTRYRPHFFPFTEPSCEVDVSCHVCGGKGCNFCKNAGWIEILGCGMVDPNVFSNCGIDPEKYTASPLVSASSASPPCATTCLTCARL